MEDKSGFVCEDEALGSDTSNLNDDDDCHNSTNENHNHLVECLEHSVGRAKLILQAQEKEDKLDSWNVEIAETYISDYCDRLIEEKAIKNESDESNNVCKVLDQQLIKNLLQNSDTKLLRHAFRSIKKLLTKCLDLISKDIEQANLMSRFYQLLEWSTEPDIQWDTAYVIKLCSLHQSPGEKRTSVRKLIYNLINFKNAKALSDALLILRREILLGGESRDQVLASGLVAALLVLVKLEMDAEHIESIIDVSSAICHTKPIPDIVVIGQLMPLLALLINHQNGDCLIPITKIVRNIIKGGPDYCQLVIDSGLLNKIMPLVCHEDRKSSYTQEVFMTLEDIAKGSDAQKIALLDAGVMVVLRFAFFNGDEVLLQHALSFLCKLVGDDCKLLQVVIDSDFFPLMVKVLEEGSDGRLRKNAAITLTSFFNIGGQEQLTAMAGRGAISTLCGLLDSGEFVPMALEAIQSFVEICNFEERRSLNSTMEKSGAYKRIETLQKVCSKLCQSPLVKVVNPLCGTKFPRPVEN